MTDADDLQKRIFANTPAADADDLQRRIFADDFADAKSTQDVAAMSHNPSDAQMRRHFLGQQAGGPLGLPGLEDKSTRAAMGWADSPEERIAAFQKQNPEGEITYAPGPGGNFVELYRMNPEDMWHEVDAPFLEKFEPVGDLLDLTGDMPEIAGEIGMAALTRGQSTARRLMASTTGSVAGELGQQGVQLMAGDQQEGARDVALRTLYTGGATLAGEKLAGGVTKGANFIGGRGVSVSPEKIMLQQVAQKRGLQGLLPGQASDSPVIQRLQKMSAAVSGKVQNAIRSQEDDVVKELAAVSNSQKAGVLARNLEEAYTNERKQILAKGLPDRHLSMKRGGEALQRGMKRFDDLANARINRLYQTARQIEEPQFDASELVEWAKETIKPKPFVKPDGSFGSQPVQMPGEVRQVLETISQMDPALPNIPLNKSANLSAENLSAAELWGASLGGTNREGAELSMFQFAQDLRRTLFDYKNPRPGEVFRAVDHKVAKDAYNQLSDVLYNPLNVDPKFANAWSKANSAASDRFGVLESDWARRTIKAGGGRRESYTQVANALAQPNNAEHITFLRGVLPKSEYKLFQDAVISDWLGKPETITKRLSSFDEPTAKALFNTTELVTMRGIGKEFDLLQDSGIQSVLTKQREDGAIIRDLVLRSDGLGIEQLAKTAPKHSPAGLSLRAAIFDNVYDEVVEENAERLVVNPKKMQHVLHQYQASGVNKLLTADEWLFLSDIKNYSQAITSMSGDAGTSLQAASTVANLRRFDPAGLRTLVEAYGTGRFLTSQMGRRMVSGTGKAPMDFKYMGRVLSALGQMNKQMLVPGNVPQDHVSQRLVDDN